jgi:hypothetical protein
MERWRDGERGRLREGETERKGDEETKRGRGGEKKNEYKDVKNTICDHWDYILSYFCASAPFFF